MSIPTPLNRRMMLHWLGLAGAAVVLPELVLAGKKIESSAISVNDLPALTAQHPILLTDDEPLILDLYRTLFAVQGLTTIQTCSATDAIEYCHCLPVSLVISDVMKPDLSGYEMIEQLKADPATAAIPVLFVSAGASFERRESAMRIGAAGYLTKPVKIPDLLDIVRNILVEQGNWQMPENFNPRMFEWLTTRNALK